MASSNQHHNNQPRRKRNKKPVKRYSEEYNNRPNPYTGYSSDGNYHPGAKKRSIDEPSVPASSHKASYDISPAAMTDAVWGPVATPPQSHQPAAKPVPSTAQRFAESQSTAAFSDTSENRPVRQTSPDPNMAHLAETATPLEGTEPERPVPKTGSHRRRNTDKQAQEQARRAKLEAKKAAVDKIAQGVAAHSASERMMDDIARMSESTAAHTAQPAAPSEPVKAATGVNWDEFYDAAFPPKETEQTAPSENQPAADRSKDTSHEPKNTSTSQKHKQKGKPPKRPRDFGEVSEQNDPMSVKPVLLDEDEALPYDLIVEENRQEAEDAAQAASASAAPPELPSDDTYRIPPLDPADLIPVLDFDKPSPDAAADQPTQETQEPESETQEESIADDDTIADVGDEISLEEFLNISSSAASESAELEKNLAEKPKTPTGYDFGADSGEGWHELTPPAVDDTPAPIEPEAPTPTLPQDDSVSLLSQRLLESYMQIEDSPLDYIPEDTADEPDVSEEFQPETVDINQFFERPEPPTTVEVEVTTDDDTPQEQPATEEPAPAPLPETANAPAEEKPAAKPKKKNRSAEPFSVVTTEQEKDTTVYVAAEEEVVKPYQPQKRPKKKQLKDENVFESVLIVDDSRSVVDDAAARTQDDMQFLHSAQPENPTAVFKMLDGPIITPSDYDDADFQEGWLDDEEGDEMTTRNKRTRRRISAFIGGMAILFAIMILGYVVGTVITGFTNIGSTSEKKAEYSAFIAPVVLNDPAPFESIDTADNQMLLESSIWRVLRQMGEDETTEFNYDATGKIVISADRVNKAGHELFGDEVSLNMNVLSESDGSAIYYYDSIDNSFHVSTFEIIGPAPVITKIAQKSDHVVLLVGYAMQDEVMSVSSDNTADCYKYMEYVLTVNGSKYHIQSVRNYVDS